MQTTSVSHDVTPSSDLFPWLTLQRGIKHAQDPPTLPTPILYPDTQAPLLSSPAPNTCSRSAPCQYHYNFTHPDDPQTRKMACPIFSDPFNPGALAPISEKPSEPIVRPDIEWVPAYKTYKDRVERLAALYPDRPTAVPEGWPTKVEGERCWNGSDLTEDDYVLKFTPEDIVEIEAALAHFKGTPPPSSPPPSPSFSH
jgi:hypothetical protein